MNAKHTPGPWEARGYWSNPNTDTLVWDKEAAICHVFPRSEMGTLNEETRTANARLIAAAPDLLASLEGLIPIAAAMNINTGVWNAQLAAACAAIARAKG